MPQRPLEVAFRGPDGALGDIDLALTHSYTNVPTATPDAVDARLIATEPVWLAVRERATRDGDAVDLRDFADHDWVVPHREWSCYNMVQRACGTAGFAPQAVAQATDFAVLLSLVAADVGVALVPQLAVARRPRGVALHRLAAPVHRHVFAATRRSMDSEPGVGLLRDRLARTAGRLVLGQRPSSARACRLRASGGREGRSPVGFATG